MFEYSPNIAINVRNLEQAQKFYNDVLGVKLVKSNVQYSDGSGTEMQAGPITLHLDSCSPEEEAHVGKVFFEFKTSNLSDALAVLDKQGCKLGRETSGKDFKGRMITDPFGMLFHVYERALE